MEEILYSFFVGRRGIDEDEQPMEMNTVMRIASATKLLTSVSAMQCVERGLLDLDVAVSTVVPELGPFQVLTGFGEDNQPILHQPKRPITLRHLLSHSSGLCYDAMHPLLVQYRKWQGLDLQPDFETIVERFTYPLVFDPGESWSYGPSLEWAGKAVERASGLTFAEKLPKERRRKLCSDVSCSVVVREYIERQKNLKGEPPAGPGLPAPRR